MQRLTEQGRDTPAAAGRTEARGQGSGQKLALLPLLQQLVSDGVVSAESAEQARGAATTPDYRGQHPLAILAKLGLPLLRAPGRKLSMDGLLEWLGARCGQGSVRIDPLKTDVVAITSVMSYAFAHRHGILAIAVGPGEVTVASAEPYVSGWEAGLEHTLRKSIRRVLASPLDIDRYQVEFYALARSVAGASSDGAGRPSGGLTNLEQMLELGNLAEADADDHHIVNIVDWLLQYAFDQRASDIHIEPRRETGKIRFRIDGVLHDVYELPLHVTQAVTSRIKILGRMNLAEKRRPQDGRLKTLRPRGGGEVELRLSTLPTAFGEKLVMRIFDPDVLLSSFVELGLTEDDYQRWHDMAHRPNGIVLVTGPTGSGKTTTLYTTLKQLAVPEVNVCTIEDPIEMVEPSFNQMQVQHNIELDFASGVRALLRQDPDIIMIGEIRDLETAEMAIQAALTGHLVLSTLHTNDAPSAITRLLEIGVPAYLIRATLLGVMAQRLVRTLCPHCKTEAPVEVAAWNELVAPWKITAPAAIQRPVGCLECRDTGYLGRQGIYEILPLDRAAARHVTTGMDLQELRRQAIRDGMRTLRVSGAHKVARGLTTIEEVMRVAPLVQER